MQKNLKEKKKTMKKLYVLFALLVVASLALSACGTPATEAPKPTDVPAPTEAAATEEPTVAPTADPMAMYMPDAVSGDILTAGSSTVFPLSERMKQRFEEEGFTGSLTVDSIGTGAGFERFCKSGETDISNASRKIKDSEKELCAAIGREAVGFQVGIDALAVVVSKENDFVTDVTLEELNKIYTTAILWSDVRPEWPAEKIQRFSPGTDSGTFDYFVEAVIAPFYKNAEGKADLAAGKAAILASAETQYSEDDNVLVQGVEGSKYAIAYFGYAYFAEESDRLNALTVNGIAPNADTAESGEYPISRPLFIYSAAKIMQEKPQVAAFIYFYVTAVADEILDVGYFPVSDAKAQENLEAWMIAMGMK
jgi:phosphate transport system substrate-binding protein